MSPKKVLDGPLQADCWEHSKVLPTTSEAYDELFKALYELFMLGRRNGMVALEEHVMTPETSAIFGKYPTFLEKPPRDGISLQRLAPDHRRQNQARPTASFCWTWNLTQMEEEHEKPVGVLTKAADAMPGFGIVAAVLGIVITMASIAGPIEQIGEQVAAALVGTFLGIFLSYGFMSPLAVNMEFVNMAELDLHQVHCGLGYRLCQRHVADHGGGSGPARLEQRSQAQRPMKWKLCLNRVKDQKLLKQMNK